MAKVEISIIIPCYNEGATLTTSVNKIVSVTRGLKRSWEIVFVEDKSADETRKTVETLIKQIKNARAIFHTRNEGRGKSVSDGIRKCRGAICGYLDVDLEVSADYIPLFVGEIEKGFDMAVGKRFYEGGLRSFTRLVASKIYARIVKLLLKIPVEDTEAGYKFFRRKSILPILNKTRDKKWFWDTEICARANWAGLKISQVPVLFVRKTDKKSSVRLIPDSWEYLVKIIKFKSNVPKTA